MAFIHVIMGAVFTVSACASECVNHAQVGRCLGTGCFMNHGPATCSMTTCYCDSGFCSKDGLTCVPTPTEPPTTTTGLVDKLVDKVDTCGVKEYMQKGSFAKSVALCVASQCSSFFSSKSVTEAKCCSLQCTADTAAAGLPDCWPQLAPLFRKQAAAMGTTGKRRNQKAACTLEGSMSLELGSDIAQALEWEALVNAAVAGAGRPAEFKPEVSMSAFVAAGCGFALAGVVGGAFMHRRRSVQFEQPPLLA